MGLAVPMQPLKATNCWLTTVPPSPDTASSVELLSTDVFDQVPTSEFARLDESVPEMSSCQTSESGTGLSCEPELRTPPIRKKVLVGPNKPEELNGMLISIPPTAPRRAGGSDIDDVFT